MSITQKEYIGRGSKHLQTVAESSEIIKMMIDLEPEEMEAARHQFQQVAIKLQQAQQDLKNITKLHKENMKPLQEEYAVLIARLKSGQYEDNVTVYHVHNHEAGSVETYTEDGVLHNTRPMSSSERSQPRRLNFSEED